MKNLTVVWGMLIFLLACLPCTDSSTALAEANTTVAQLADNHHGAGQEADICSPLCECNCCGGITLSFHIPSLSGVHPVPQSSPLSTYAPEGAASPSFSFWHPPKA
ncbi:DUF6660 family protein [Pontibacter saemangeumensis]|uniref:DUF6660 family protein n=1 Tax=Pontibacter saemangeumensis TaxID=1084525 RepID=UPI0031EBE75E